MLKHLTRPLCLRHQKVGMNAQQGDNAFLIWLGLPPMPILMSWPINENGQAMSQLNSHLRDQLALFYFLTYGLKEDEYSESVG